MATIAFDTLKYAKKTEICFANQRVGCPGDPSALTTPDLAFQEWLGEALTAHHQLATGAKSVLCRLR